MKRAASESPAGALLCILALFATPLHLALVEHEWVHEQAEEDHRHDGESHPAADHELAALSRAVKPLPILVETTIVPLTVVEPQVSTWTPAVESESNGPPEHPHAPPRSPRAPPL